MFQEPKSVMSAVVSVLNLHLPCRVATEAPTDREHRFVRVSRIGGGMINPVTDNARILVECFASSGLQAEQLANKARHVLLNLQAQTHKGVFVRGVKETSGPVDFPDQFGPRYQFTIEVLAAT